MRNISHYQASTAAALVNPATEAAPSAAPAAVPGTPAALLQDKVSMVFSMIDFVRMSVKNLVHLGPDVYRMFWCMLFTP